jgi:opacity protein-like surface antigen
MMKKFLAIAATCLLASTSAIAVGTLYFAPTLVLETNTNENANYTGLTPRLTLGYGEQINPYFSLAGEVFGTPIVMDVKNNFGNGGMSLKTSWNYGASVLPAVNVNSEVMGYLRFGGIESHFHSIRETTPGLQLGIGLQAEVSDVFDIRGEYIYTTYRSENGIGSVKQDMYTLGFVRKFNL